MDIKKKAFIEAYKKAFGNISKACKAVGIDRKTFYNWKKDDVKFYDVIESVEPEEEFLDFIDNALVERINDGDTTAIIFACKTKGKKRGYVERQEITGKDGHKLFEVNIVDGNQ